MDSILSVMALIQMKLFTFELMGAFTEECGCCLGEFAYSDEVDQFRPLQFGNTPGCCDQHAC